MSQIEVPSWVVEVGAEAISKRHLSNTGMPFPIAACREDALAVITAALGAWVVPVGYENRWHLTGNKWLSRDPAHRDDGDSQTAYVLRQEKPE